MDPERVEVDTPQFLVQTSSPVPGQAAVAGGKDISTGGGYSHHLRIAGMESYINQMGVG